MFNNCTSSFVTQTGVITDDRTFLTFVTLQSDEDAEVVVQNKDSEGNIIFKAKIKGGDSSRHFHFGHPIIVKDGIYVSLSTGATATIGYFG